MWLWQRSSTLSIFLFLQLWRSATAGCRYDTYEAQSSSQGDCGGNPIASYTVEQHVCTILENLPYGFHYKVVPLSLSDKYFGPYNPKPDDPCNFYSAKISKDFNTCFWWNVAQYHYTQFGMTCLNDTNVYDATAIPPNLAQTQSLSATTTPSATTITTSGFYTTRSTPSTVQPSNPPIASDGPDKESIGLQKQGNKIGLAVGLGVGIPALLLALVGLFYQMRMHRRHAQPNASPATAFSSRPQIPLTVSGPPGSTIVNVSQQSPVSPSPQHTQQNGVVFQQQMPWRMQS